MTGSDDLSEMLKELQGIARRLDRWLTALETIEASGQENLRATISALEGVAEEMKRTTGHLEMVVGQGGAIAEMAARLDNLEQLNARHRDGLDLVAGLVMQIAKNLSIPPRELEANSSDVSSDG